MNIIVFSMAITLNNCFVKNWPKKTSEFNKLFSFVQIEVFQQKNFRLK